MRDVSGVHRCCHSVCSEKFPVIFTPCLTQGSLTLPVPAARDARYMSQIRQHIRGELKVPSEGLGLSRIFTGIGCLSPPRTRRVGHPQGAGAAESACTPASTLSFFSSPFCHPLFLHVTKGEAINYGSVCQRSLSVSPPPVGSRAALTLTAAHWLTLRYIFFSSFLSLREHTYAEESVCAAAADNGKTFSTRWMSKLSGSLTAAAAAVNPLGSKKAGGPDALSPHPRSGWHWQAASRRAPIPSSGTAGPCLSPLSLPSPFPSSRAHGPPSRPSAGPPAESQNARLALSAERLHLTSAAVW